MSTVVSPNKPSPQPLLFTHSLAESGILQLDDIVYNDAPTFRKFVLSSLLPDVAVTVHLTSSSPCLRFQLRNENITSAEMINSGLNSVFNEVGIIDEVTLEPGGKSVEVVAVFTAKPHHIVLSGQAQPLSFNGIVTMVGKAAGFAECTQTINFISKIYLSVMKVSPTDLKKVMAPDKTQSLEFTVTNASDLELKFVARLQTLVECFSLHLYDYEKPTESCIGMEMALAPHQSQRFEALITTPTNTKPGNYSAALQFDNLRDVRNTTLVKISLQVISGKEFELVSLLSLNEFNFGDIYRGTEVTQRFEMICNNSRDPVTLQLIADSKDAAEGSLHLDAATSVTNQRGGSDESEEIILPPQKPVWLTLHYKPHYADEDSPLVVQKAFQVSILAKSPHQPQYVATLQCSCTLHTSNIDLVQQLLKFGDTQVGRSKKVTLQIMNESYLEGAVLIKFNSKIISVPGYSPYHTGEFQEVIRLLPNKITPVELYLEPRRVNPRYRKQIIVVNQYNPSEEQQFIVTLESNNIASDESKLHDAVYRCQFVEMGGTSGISSLRGANISAVRNESTSSSAHRVTAISGLPCILCYQLQRVINEEIAIEANTTCSEITLLGFSQDQTDQEELRSVFEQLYATMENLISISYKEKEPQFSDIMQMAESRNALVNFIKAKLVPLDSDGSGRVQILLQSDQPYYVYVMISRSSTEFTQFAAKEDSLNLHVKSIPHPRIVRISYRNCSSVFDLGKGQKNKQFGKIFTGEKKQIKVAVSNKTEVPLFFCILKNSKSVMASYLSVENVSASTYYSFIRPFAKKELDIFFTPGMRGSVKEQLTIVNILDPRNEEIITVKAEIEKSETFEVVPTTLTLGEVHVSQKVNCAAKMVLTNTGGGPKQRHFCMKFEQPDSFFKFTNVNVIVTLEVENAGSATGSIRRIEETIEKIEQKLKIYQRKGKKEKAALATKRLEALQKALAGGSEAAMDDAAGSKDFESSEDEGELSNIREKRKVSNKRNIIPFDAFYEQCRSQQGILLPGLNSMEQLNIAFSFELTRIQQSPITESSTMNLLFFDATDVEVRKSVVCELSTSTSSDVEKVGSFALDQSPLLASPRSVVQHPSDTLSVVECHGFEFENFFGMPLINIHNTTLHEVQTFSFFVRISSEIATPFVILTPTRCGGEAAVPCCGAKFRFTPQNASAVIHQNCKIVGEVTPRDLGPQKYVVQIRNLKDRSEVLHIALALNPVIEDDLLELEPKEVDFGVVPIAAASKSDHRNICKSLVIRNRTNEVLRVLARSNLPSQIQLFENGDLTNVVSSPVEIPPKGIFRLYIKLLPILDKVRFEANKHRTLVAGLTADILEVTLSGQYALISSYIAKLTAFIVPCVLKLKEEGYDFGTVAPQEELTGTLTIVNPSECVDVRLRVVPEHSTTYIVQQQASSQLLLQARSSKELAFTVQNKGCGLLQENILVYNETVVDQEPLQFTIQALIIDGSVTVCPTVLDFPVTAVIWNEEQNQFEVAESPQEVNNLQLINNGESDMQLVAKTDMPVVLLSSGIGDSLQNNEGHLLLHAKATLSTQCKVFGKLTFTSEQQRSLHTTGMVSLSSSMSIEMTQTCCNLSLGQTVALLKIHLTFAVSSAKILNPDIQLGKIGANTRWAPAPFVITIQNGSPDLPLKLIAQLPSPDIELSLPEGNVIQCEPEGCVKLAGQLLTSKLTESVTNNIEKSIVFENQLRPKEVLTCVVKAKLYPVMWRFFVDGKKELVRQHSKLEPFKLPTIELDLEADYQAETAYLSGSRLVIHAAEEGFETSLTVLINDDIEQIILLQIMNFQTMVPLTSLPSNVTKHDLRIRSKLKKGASRAYLASVFFPARINPLEMTFEKALELWDQRGQISPPLLLGTLRFSDGKSETDDEDLPIISQLHPFNTFSVSSTKVQLKRVHSDGSNKSSLFSNSVEIHNVTDKHTVDLACGGYLKSQIESVAKIWCYPNQCTLSPGSKVDVTIFVQAAEGTENTLEQSMCTLFYDGRCHCSLSLLMLSITPYDALVIDQVEEDTDRSVTSSEVNDSRVETPCASAFSQFDVRNCTPLGEDGRYTLSFQPTMAEVESTCDIKLQNRSNIPLDFLVVVGTEDPKPWLTLSAKSGRIKPGEISSLKLTGYSKEIGAYVAQLILRSSTSYADMKFIRVTLDVCASGSYANSLFDVITDKVIQSSGLRKYSRSQPKTSSLGSNLSNPSEIDFGTLFGSTESTQHYVDVSNRADTELDFQFSVTKPFKVSFVDAETGQDEILPSGTTPPFEAKFFFSLTQYYLVSFSSLAIPPHSTIRVYLFLAVESHFPPSMSYRVNTEIIVKCRIARDAQKSIQLKMMLRPQQFQVSRTVLNFDSTQPTQKFQVCLPLDSAPNYSLLGSPNNGSDPLLHVEYIAMTTSVAFVIKYASGSLSNVNIAESPALSPDGAKRPPSPVHLDEAVTTVSACSPIASSPTSRGHKQTITVEALPEKMKDREAQGIRVLQDHLIVYNKNYPKEKVTIQLVYFFAQNAGTPFTVVIDAATRVTAVFTELEKQAHTFLRKFLDLASETETSANSLLKEAEKLLETSDISTLSDGKGEAAQIMQRKSDSLYSTCFSVNVEAFKTLYIELHFLVDELQFYLDRGKGQILLLNVGSLLVTALLNHPLFQPYFKFCQAGLHPESPYLMNFAPAYIMKWIHQIQYLSDLMNGPQETAKKQIFRQSRE